MKVPFVDISQKTGHWKGLKPALGGQTGENKLQNIAKMKQSHRISHVDWVTSLPPGGDRSLNTCLVLAHRYKTILMFLPCHRDDTAMDTAIIIWNRLISIPGLLQKVISDRDPRFTSALWTNLHNLFGRKTVILNSLSPSD
ncbi:hypothetical protein O181_016982 [Austropuccinia psidii MF-1]|uniref:Integrase catalytic domain-containing protein n=1 Tax=Austropuccinia psidii MF-1 TaxID=1389203 RepID=A0A9Q3GS64_9BASI|nr:hypothetical protein [Austropuccinia psidii MF-1]